MDSNVLIAGIGVVGTLLGAFIGAWLNPYMQERKETRRLKRILKEANPLDKFIILNAYRNVYLPLDGMIIIPNLQLSLEDRDLINRFNEHINILQLDIRRMGNERILFVQEQEYKGCRLALRSEFYFLINQDKKIQEQLIEGNKYFIKKIYSLYEKLMESDVVFKLLQRPQQNTNTTLMNINIFMHNINVFNVFGDLSYLNLTSPKAYLNFPKREFHPEYEGT